MKKIILNEWFGVFALTLLLIPQIEHTVYLYQASSHFDDPWWAWCYALGIDLAILIFTVKGWVKTALAYLFGTYACNLFYQYWAHNSASGILIHLLLSGSIFLFSHLFFKQKADKRKADANEKQPSEKALQLTAALDVGIRFEAQPYLCPECGESFVNSKKLNGHISGHKQKENWHPERYGEWEKENQERAKILTQFQISNYVRKS